MFCLDFVWFGEVNYRGSLYLSCGFYVFLVYCRFFVFV